MTVSNVEARETIRQALVDWNAATDEQRTAALQAVCDHQPTDDGASCARCGLASRPVGAAELTAALVDELEVLGAIAPRECGQQVADDDRCGEPAIALVLDDETYRCVDCLAFYAMTFGLIREVQGHLIAGIARFLDAR